MEHGRHGKAIGPLGTARRRGQQALAAGQRNIFLLSKFCLVTERQRSNQE
jgi:hypothetical protein